MTQEQFDKFWEGIISNSVLRKAINSRQKEFLIQTVEPELVEKYLEDGWVVDRVFKKKTRLKKLKPADIAFEDDVWCIFANLGFTHLSKDRNFKIPYSDDFTLKQQIDVFAADKETILLIECKATDGEPKKGNFKESIEAIGGKKDGIIKAVKKLFPSQNIRSNSFLQQKNTFCLSPTRTGLTISESSTSMKR